MTDHDAGRARASPARVHFYPPRGGPGETRTLAGRGGDDERRSITGRVKPGWGLTLRYHGAWLGNEPRPVAALDDMVRATSDPEREQSLPSAVAAPSGAAPADTGSRVTTLPARLGGTGRPTRSGPRTARHMASHDRPMPSRGGAGRGWTAAALIVAALVCLPVLSVVYLAFSPVENIWPHLVDTVLLDYVSNTVLLMTGVAIGTSSIGISTAWFVTHHEFPGRRLFKWALLLPFAVPAYVIAYVYTDLLEFSGPVQSLLRDLFDWRTRRDYWFPSIRSLPGAITMLTLVLYPYVYLLARAAFLEQSVSILEAARVLGGTRRTRFLRVALPMARPAIAVGVAMAMMECLNDFGTVDYFAVRTLSAGLYDVWLGMNNLGGGAQIATLMLVFVLMLLGLEKASRRRQQHFQPGATRFRTIERRRLVGPRALLTSTVCATPVVLGFVIPAAVLMRYAWLHFGDTWNPAFREIALNSVLLSGTAACVAVAIGTLLSYSRRLGPTRVLNASIALAGLGYAVPGAVLAIGVMIPFAAFDNALDAVMRARFGLSTGLLLSGTVVALVFAYTVRFLAVAHGSIDASMRKISPHMDDAARSLGRSPFAILRSVHLPLMRGGILTAALVVFVDCMKELPATLVLRPFDFDTLATHVYQYASDEQIAEASLGALLIVLVGLAPVILLTRSIDRSRELRAPAALIGIAGDPLAPAGRPAPA